MKYKVYDTVLNTVCFIGQLDACKRFLQAYPCKYHALLPV